MALTAVNDLSRSNATYRVMHAAPSLAAGHLAHHVWHSRYRHDGERSPEDSLRRVARALAAAEPARGQEHDAAFLAEMRSARFLPGGRILAGAGTGRRVTLFNCFVMGTIEDSIEGIFRALQDAALTMQQGGGIGCDFSTLRPRGTSAHGIGGTASGPVSFMRIWDRMCATMLSTGVRRGAMMATLRCDHPDIEDFVDAKREAGALPNFNLSVLVSDAFLAAVRADADWPLVFPDEDGGGSDELLERWWSGHDWPVPCRVHRRVGARALWQRIMRTAYDSAEPGVLFVDRINRENNLGWCERIGATNPCGEVPLPPFGACDLGSLSLTRFVRDPFTASARFDLDQLAASARVAVRMLDNAITVSGFPLPAQARRARGSRRIGLGLMGLADALVMLGLRYDSEAARACAADAMRTICHAAYRASTELAAEKGAFPLFECDSYLAASFVAALPADIRDSIAAHGIRNSHLTAIAPTGSISLFAGEVSSGLEPIVAPMTERGVRQADGSIRNFTIPAASLRLWHELGNAGQPPAFMTADAIAPRDQLAMQAALQAHVDNAISKTLAIPEALPFDDFAGLYEEADRLGLKGCTAFRPGGIRGCMVHAA